MSSSDCFRVWALSLLSALAVSTGSADAQSVDVEIKEGHSFTEPKKRVEGTLKEHIASLGDDENEE